MNLELVEKIADAVLYEGYMLYPYRASSVKNRQRFNWGALAPKSYSDEQHGTEAWEMQTECLVEGADARLDIKVRFLHLTDRKIGKVEETGGPDNFNFVPTLEVDGKLHHAFQEAVERGVVLPPLELSESEGVVFPFSFPQTSEVEPILNSDRKIAGEIVRAQRGISGEVVVNISTFAENALKKVTVQIRNTTAYEIDAESDRDAALLSSLVSTHTILAAQGGEFISLLDPPEEYSGVVAGCQNKGAFPVLAGDEGERNCMLSSPIILYDYPEIAPESAGDLFDGAEIDEILTLRIMTLTDEEKREMRGTDDRVRRILERTEMMPDEQLAKMHGTMRGLNKVN